MSNIIKSSDNNFTIDENGNGYIAQRRLAEIFGLNHTTIGRWIKNAPPEIGCFTNEINQLNSKLLVKCTTHYALKGNISAIKFQAQLAQAGAEVFIRGMMGIESRQAQLEAEVSELKLELISSKVGIDTKARHKILKSWVRKGWLFYQKKTKHTYKLTNLGENFLTKIDSHFELIVG